MLSDYGSRCSLMPLFGTLCLGLLLSGCGGGASAPKAEAKGKITFNGAPVKSGTIVLAPVTGSGEQANGDVQQDGTFVMKTGTASGAPIGKNMVSYKPKIENFSPPDDWDSSKGEPPRPKSEYEGLIPKEKEVEIKSGDNDITVELVPGQ